MSNNQQEVCSQCCCPVATAEQAATFTDEPYTCYWPYGGDCAEDGHLYSASWEKRALAAEKKLEHVLQQWKWLSEDVEAALRDQKNRSKGGQQTGHGPELSYIPTSDLLRLRWRCNEALKGGSE